MSAHNTPLLTLKQLLSDQPLATAMQSLESQIKQHPTDPVLRKQLFGMLCLFGDWQRALRQLQLHAQLQPDSERDAQVYRGLIRCELHRQGCLAGKHQPNFLLPPPSWVEQMLEAIALEGDKAENLRLQALSEVPDISGQVTPGGSFEWISDSDTWLGPVLEVVVGGRYTWIPFEQMQQINSHIPHTALDLIWKPITFRLLDQSEHHGFLLARDGNVILAHDNLRLCRETRWEKYGRTSVRTQGQKTWQTNSGDIGVLDITSCVFTPTTSSTPPEIVNV